MFSDAFIEALKELLRVAVLAVLPLLIGSIEKGEIDYRAVLIVAVVAILRFIDSWLHETNKELPVKKQNDGLLGEKGITGF
jgi:hypothetical protein